MMIRLMIEIQAQNCAIQKKSLVPYGKIHTANPFPGKVFTLKNYVQIANQKVIFRNGSMFRGNPPQGKLFNLTSDLQDSLLSGESFQISFNDLVWQAPDTDLADKFISKGDLYLKINLVKKPWKKGGWEETTTHLARIPAQSICRDRIKFNQESVEECVSNDHGEIDVQFEVEHHKDKTDCFCLKYKGIKSLAINWHPFKIDPIQGLGSFPFTHQVRSRKCSTHIQGQVLVKSLGTKKVWKKFEIEAGSFYDCVMPEDVEALWGPIPLSKLPQGLDNECKAVTHGVIDGNRKVLSVYLIHSLPLEMSAIQIFYGDKMSVVAHLVGGDTIGYESELHIDTDFAGLPWRAMIIKDNQGTT